MQRVMACDSYEAACRWVEVLARTEHPGTPLGMRYVVMPSGSAKAPPTKH